MSELSSHNDFQLDKLSPSEVPTMDQIHRAALDNTSLREIPTIDQLHKDAEVEPEQIETESLSDTESLNYIADLQAEEQSLRLILAREYRGNSRENRNHQDKQAESIASSDSSENEESTKATLERIEPLIEKGKISRSRPIWEEHFPIAGDDQSEKEYQTFLEQFPITTQIHIEALRKVTEAKESLLSDENIAQQWHEFGESRREILQQAATVRVIERREIEIAETIFNNESSATKHGVSLSKAEKDFNENLKSLASELGQIARSMKANPDVLLELRRRDALDDRRQIRKGLLDTEETSEIIKTRVPLLMLGKPLLLTGETGTAKTVLARHIAREYFGVEADVISGKEDVNAYVLMGKPGLVGRDGATETVFKPGPITRAMIEGKPVIIDEINQMRSEDVSGLNYILQLRPGDEVTIQEDSGQTVIVKSGFCIIATANMKSEVSPSRYINRNEIDTATQQRFKDGAGEAAVHYPDHDLDTGEIPLQNLRLISAILTNGKGEVILPPGISVDQLIAFARVAHASQKFFSTPSVVGNVYVDSQTITQGKPALELAVLAPREVRSILEQVRDTNGRFSFEAALTEFIAQQKLVSDRVVLAKLTLANKLLQSINEHDLRIPEGSLRGFSDTP